MSVFLRNLLDAKEPLFGSAMAKLEHAAGKSGVDVRLIADVMASAHTLMRAIGLDPKDTTYQELRRGLAAHSSDDQLFANTAYVGLVFPEGVVSFNQQDVLDDHSLDHLHTSLQHELVSRYVSHPRTADAVVEQFARDAGLWYTADNHKQKETEETDTVAEPYILSIGDIVTDAFIKLRDDQARVDTDPDGSKRLSMDFGSKPPYDHVDIIQAVGPSPNAAVSCARLGVHSGLMAYLGDDLPGKESLAYLQQQNVDGSTLSVQSGLKSNYWYVLSYGAERTILVKNEPYDFTWQEPTQVPDWIYLSALDERSWDLHTQLSDYITAHSEVKLVFQPGTFHFRWGTEKLAGLYAQTHMLCLNKEEAAQVAGIESTDIAELAAALHNLGPKIVVITDGPNGSYASDGTKVLSIPNYPDPAPPVDRTGAGDAFASTITAALALGNSLEVAMTWAPINSAFVCQQLGAQAGLLSREQIEEYLQAAPSEYAVVELV
jgi:sugar/nucleoside kinase (ribokinase family)